MAIAYLKGLVIALEKWPRGSALVECHLLFQTAHESHQLVCSQKHQLPQHR
jgi:hypothetical protein